ncbi:hypothetical protein AB1Y20_022829 [Prymnesium parvum]|uniref:NERD domain-containing protein n=1 Tax=Prymnesium parvum TaxID=97485 RepID=A0AB34JDP4_PRYPA
MWGRLQDARDASRPSSYDDIAHHAAGRLAEARVAAQLASSRAPFGELRLWRSLRVPCAPTGRAEIDLVVVSAAGVHLLEVKHWAGAVRLDADGGWVQTRANGTIVRHGDVAAKLRAKAEAVQAYLRSQRVELPAGAVEARVLLTHEACAASEQIEAMEGVLSRAAAAAYLCAFEQSMLSNLAARWLPGSLGGRKLQPALLAPLCAALDRLGVWDRLTLNGGRVIDGDARGFVWAGKPHAAYELPALRQVASEIVFEHRRSITVGSLLAVLGHEPATTLRPALRRGAPRAALPPPAPIPIHAELAFQPAGHPKVQTFRVNDIEKLELSS